MHTPTPFWFACCISAILLALMISLLLLPATAQPGGAIAGPTGFHFPRL